MAARVRLTYPCVLASLVMVLVACGGGGGGSGGRSTRTPSNELTIYSSQPLLGPSRAQAQSLVDAERLALDEVHARVGRFTIDYVALDDATQSSGHWEPGQTSANARKAAADQSAIAYLGDADSGASAVSLPILNEIGMLQVSPASTYVGLTRSEGADTDEPQRYYPAGRRTFGRVVPTDDVQAAAQVTYQKDEGCTQTFILSDQGVYGKALAKAVARRAAAQGPAIAASEPIDGKARDFRAVATKVAASGADCMFFGGTTPNGAARLFMDIHSANPSMKLFGADGVADTAFASRLNPGTQKATYVTSPTLAPSAYPPAGQRFFAKFRERYGRDPEPDAIFGYEAMKVVLRAIEAAGPNGNDRQAVIDAFFQTKDRASVLGTYSIDQNGDTSLSDYAGDRILYGRLVLDRVIHAVGG